MHLNILLRLERTEMMFLFCVVYEIEEKNHLQAELTYPSSLPQSNEKGVKDQHSFFNWNQDEREPIIIVIM